MEVDEISEINLSKAFKKIINKDFGCTYGGCYRRIFTSKLLYRMKLVDNPEYPPCRITPEAIEHEFSECQMTIFKEHYKCKWVKRESCIKNKAYRD